LIYDCFVTVSEISHYFVDIFFESLYEAVEACGCNELIAGCGAGGVGGTKKTLYYCTA